MRYLRVDTIISQAAAWLGAGLGVYSHVLLDALMHADAQPWAPVSPDNPFNGMLSYQAIKLICLLMFLLAALGYAVRAWWRRRQRC